MPELLSSKIVVIEEEPRIRSLPQSPTAVLGIVGLFERGEIGKATKVVSFAEFVDRYGSVSNSGGNTFFQGPIAVRNFFLNGGRQAVVVRTAHYSDIDAGTLASATRASRMYDTAATAPGPAIVTGANFGPFALTPGDTLVGSVTGNPNQTATFNANRAQRLAASSQPYGLVNGDTLTFQINGGPLQTITFTSGQFVDITAATAAEVAAAINAQMFDGFADVSGTAVRLNSDRQGSTSSISAVGGTAAAAFGFGAQTGGSADGPGNNVANIAAVTISEIETLVEAAWTSGGGVSVLNIAGAVRIQTNATGPVETLQVIAASTADDELGLDNAVHSGTSGAAVDTLLAEGRDQGAYGNEVQVQIATATAPASIADVATNGFFNLNVFRNGVLLEQFPNVSMNSLLPNNYAPSVINRAIASGGSRFVRVTDQISPGTALQRRPDVTAPPHPFLAGGNNGLTALADDDFSGSSASQTGLRAFDTDPDVSLLIAPDRPTTNVQSSMITYAEVTRNRELFAILEVLSTETDSASDVLAHKAALTATENAGLWWPWVRIPNPNPVILAGTGGGPAPSLVEVSPAGFIAGIMARNDANTLAGTFTQPASTEDGVLQGAVAVFGPADAPAVLREEVRDLIFPERVNPIITLPGTGVFIDGARTLKGDGNFPSVGERRGVSFIERTLKRGLLFAKNKNNTPELRATVRRTIISFLLEQMRRGAFVSRDPEKAFFVDVSDSLNTPSVVASGRMLIRIGLATNKPAEFIILLVSQDTRAIEEEIAGI